MQRSPLRDLALVAVAGAATPYALLAIGGRVHAAIRGPSDRIVAFLAPGLRWPRHDLGMLAIDAALGVLLGVALGAIIARATRSGRWILWLLFVAALLVSMLAVAGSDGMTARLAVLVRQPMILFVVCGAGMGFALTPRSDRASTTR